MKNKPTKTVATSATSNYFSRKIGNTTFMVSVSFSEKTAESVEDKILRLVVSDMRKEAQKCG